MLRFEVRRQQVIKVSHGAVIIDRDSTNGNLEILFNRPVRVFFKNKMPLLFLRDIQGFPRFRAWYDSCQEKQETQQ